MNRPGRIIQLRISGMRVIEDLTLDLGGLTVLIGDNGTGKSTILEALELLRLASHPMSFVRDVISSRHGGIDALLRRGAEQLSLGCRLRSAEGILIDYGFTIRVKGSRPFIDEEFAEVLENDLAGAALAEFDRGAQSEPKSPVRFEDDELVLSKVFTESPLLSLIRTILGSIDVQAPFETRPFWQQRELELRASPRMPCIVETTAKLSRYGTNLAMPFKRRGIAATRCGSASSIARASAWGPT